MILHRPLDPATKATVACEWQSARFESSWAQTCALLQMEADHLTGRTRSDVFVEVDLPASAIRLDGGGIRSNAKAPDTPVVAVAIPGTRHGDLRLVSARYGNRYHPAKYWQHNVRAVALTLQALRAVDRWGATTGEQYRGFAALGAGGPIAMGTGMTRAEATALLRDATCDGTSDSYYRIIGDGETANAALALAMFRAAAKIHHPDAGGDPETFRRLVEARDLLTGGPS